MGWLRRIITVSTAAVLCAPVLATPVSHAAPDGTFSISDGSVAAAFANKKVNTKIAWSTGGKPGNAPNPNPKQTGNRKPCQEMMGKCVLPADTWVVSGEQFWDANPAEREHAGQPANPFDRKLSNPLRSWLGPGQGSNPSDLNPNLNDPRTPADAFINAAGVGVAVKCSANSASVLNPVTGAAVNFYPHGYAWRVTFDRKPPIPIYGPGDPQWDTDPDTGAQTPQDSNGDGQQDIGAPKLIGYEEGPTEIFVNDVNCLFPADPVFETQSCALTYRAPGTTYPTKAATISGPFGEGLPARNLTANSNGRLTVEQISSTVATTRPSINPAGTTDFHDDVYTPGNNMVTAGDGDTARAWANAMVNCSKVGFADLDFTLAAPGNYRVNAVVDVITCGWYRFGAGWYKAGVESVVWVGCGESEAVQLTEWMWKGCTGVITGKTAPSLQPPISGADATILGFPPAETTRGEANDWNPARCANARCTWNPVGGFDPGQLKVTIIGQNPSRSGTSEVVLDADVTQEPEDLTDALSDKMWLAKADGATAYKFSHFLRNIRIDAARGSAKFIGTVWQTTDSATPWRLNPFTRDRLEVLDNRQPFKVTTVGAGGSKVSPLVVTEYDRRGEDAELTLGLLPQGMSTNPDHLANGQNDLIMRFYAPGNVGGLDDKYSKGKVTGFPIRAIGVWDVTYDDYSTDLGTFGAPSGVIEDTDKIGTASVAKICHTQWTTMLPIAAGR